jgi:hypothetical protein
LEEKPLTKEQIMEWIELTELHPIDSFPAKTVQRMGYQLLQVIEDLELKDLNTCQINKKSIDLNINQ